MQRAVETVGSLVAWVETVVKTEQPGTVSKLLVDLGDSVTQGKILAEYDAREFQLAVDQSEADLLSSRQAASRAQATVASSEASLRRVRDGLSALQAEVAAQSVAGRSGRSPSWTAPRSSSARSSSPSATWTACGTATTPHSPSSRSRRT